MGYAYEKGYVTGKPDLDQAVSYYERKLYEYFRWNITAQPR